MFKCLVVQYVDICRRRSFQPIDDSDIVIVVLMIAWNIDHRYIGTTLGRPLDPGRAYSNIASQDNDVRIHRGRHKIFKFHMNVADDV